MSAAGLGVGADKSLLLRGSNFSRRELRINVDTTQRTPFVSAFLYFKSGVMAVSGFADFDQCNIDASVNDEWTFVCGRTHFTVSAAEAEQLRVFLKNIVAERVAA